VRLFADLAGMEERLSVLQLMVVPGGWLVPENINKVGEVGEAADRNGLLSVCCNLTGKVSMGEIGGEGERW